MRYLCVEPSKTRCAPPGGSTSTWSKEDDKNFYYKVYRPRAAAGSGGRRRRPPAGGGKKIAATYRCETPESQRLKFVPFGNGLPNRGQWRNGFDIADMNGDGHPDIVHSPARKDAQSAGDLPGRRQGELEALERGPVPAPALDYGDAAVGDFNGDGHPDIALGVHLRGLMALLGDGKGGFTEVGKGLDFQLPGKGRRASGFSSRTIAVADWNHDGRPTSWRWARGRACNRDGRATRPGRPRTRSRLRRRRLPQPGERHLAAQGPGDLEPRDLRRLDRDRATSTATTAWTSRPASSIQGRKSLVNSAARTAAGTRADLDDVQPPLLHRARSTPSTSTATAWTTCRRLHRATRGGPGRNGIDILYSRKDGTWKRRGLVAAEQTDATGQTALAHGDLDGDGKLDLVALTGDGGHLGLPRRRQGLLHPRDGDRHPGVRGRLHGLLRAARRPRRRRQGRDRGRVRRRELGDVRPRPLPVRGGIPAWHWRGAGRRAKGRRSKIAAKKQIHLLTARRDDPYSAEA